MNIRAQHERRPSAVAIMVSAVVVLPMMMSAPGAGIALDDAERGFVPGRTTGVLTTFEDVERGFVPGHRMTSTLSFDDVERAHVPGNLF